MRKRRTKKRDGIVEDVRKARAALLADFGNDIRRLGHHLMAEQAKTPGLVVYPRRHRAVS